jgi:hypothetical protein
VYKKHYFCTFNRIGTIGTTSSVAIWNKKMEQNCLVEVDGKEESDGGAHETTKWQQLCQGLRIFS